MRSVDEDNSLNDLAAKNNFLQAYNKVPLIEQAYKTHCRKNRHSVETTGAATAAAATGDGDEPNDEGEGMEDECDAADEDSKRSFKGIQAKKIQWVFNNYPDTFETGRDYRRAVSFFKTMSKEGLWESYAQWVDDHVEFTGHGLVNHKVFTVNMIIMEKLSKHESLIQPMIEVLKFAVPNTDTPWRFREAKDCANIDQLLHSMRGTKAFRPQRAVSFAKPATQPSSKAASKKQA